MKRALVELGGRSVWVTVSADDQLLTLSDETQLSAEGATFLAPVSPGASVFALGLNYADRSAQLGFKAPTEPLVFLKGGNAFVGHHGKTPLPADATQMHPECELVAVIGKPAKGVKRAKALNYVSGYTIANDFAIRNYLENYYRPNLRVKNRDAATPLGPWIVDAADVADPQRLKIRSFINDKQIQDGSTSEMIFDVASLIEYLSSFATLMPGDLILTGTPHGVDFVRDGDVVTCEIEGVGRLVNHIEAVR